MSNTFRYLLAICIAILPVNIVMIWYRLTQTENFTTTEMTIYPLAIGGGISLLIFLLNKHLVRSTFTNTFNPGEGKWYQDILVGIGLTVIYFMIFFVSRMTIYQWIPNNAPPNTELIDTMVDLAHDPWLLLLWFGPVLWIGVALFEELSRVFMLQCLWWINKNKDWHIIVIFLTSTLIGMTHLYQGTAGIISIGLKSLIACFYFYKYRRFWPLVIAHALYDGIQFAFFIMEIRQ